MKKSRKLYIKKIIKIKLKQHIYKCMQNFKCFIHYKYNKKIDVYAYVFQKGVYIKIF